MAEIENHKNSARSLFFASYHFMKKNNPLQLNDWLQYVLTDVKNIFDVTDKEFEEEWVQKADEQYKASE